MKAIHLTSTLWASQLTGNHIPPELVGERIKAQPAQVDYGSGPMVRDPQSGKYRRTRLFVLTLGYSRKCVCLLTWRSSVGTWAELHEQAFRRLGGCPRLIVLDNLKEGVKPFLRSYQRWRGRSQKVSRDGSIQTE